MIGIITIKLYCKHKSFSVSLEVGTYTVSKLSAVYCSIHEKWQSNVAMKISSL